MKRIYNTYSPVSPYRFRQPVIGAKFRQRTRRRRALEIPGGTALWSALARRIVLIGVVLIGVSVCLNMIARNSGRLIDDLESARYELKDRQIGLAIERRALASEQRIRGDAIRYLALMDAREDQVISLR
jgi:hypothetical protein